MAIRCVDSGVDRGLALGLLIAGAATVFAPAWVLAATPDCLISRFVGGGVCWGCGITRAILKFAHLDFRAAIAANPLVLIVAPSLAWVGGSFFLKTFRHRRELAARF